MAPGGHMTKVSLVVSLICLAQLGLPAQQSADFSGNWKQIDPPGRQVWTIEQTARDVTLRITVDDREVRTTNWTFGGPATFLPSAIGTASGETTASVVGNEIVFQGSVGLALGPTPLEERWQIDEQGQLKVSKVASSTAASFRMELLFARVP
jgi:hypothetical protein